MSCGCSHLIDLFFWTSGSASLQCGYPDSMSTLDEMPEFANHQDWMDFPPALSEQCEGDRKDVGPPAPGLENKDGDGEQQAPGKEVGGEAGEAEVEELKAASFASTPVKSLVSDKLSAETELLDGEPSSPAGPALQPDVQEVESPSASPRSPKGRGRGGKGAKGRGRGKGKGKGKDPPADDQSVGPGAEGSVKSAKTSKSKSQSIGQKNKSKTHVRFCKGCNLWYQGSDMANKQNLCHRDKYALDNITRAAVAAGKKDWVKELRSDPAKLQEVLSKYRNLVGTDSGARTKMTPNSMFQALQEVSAKSRVLFDSELEFMSEDAYMVYSGTDAGGRLSKTAARAQWNQWEDQIAAGEAPDDLIYDTKKGFLRIACSTRDTVHLQNDIRIVFSSMLFFSF